MNKTVTQLSLFALTIFFCLTLIFPASVEAQRRDFLTAEEIELVRDAQAIDQRIEVLVKAVDRRFLVLNKDDSQAKQVQKDLEKWGELPTGTENELLSDIDKILQKAVDDIDDLVANQEMNERVLRDGANTSDVDEEFTKYKIKTNKKQFPIAVHYLADAARRYIPMLEVFVEKSSAGGSRGSVYRALENSRLIIEASAKVPRYTKKKKKKDS